MQATELSDRELIVRISLDDEEAFGMLFNRYWKRLYELVYRISGDEAQSKDILQEVFFYIWKKRKQLYDLPSFEPYLVSAAKNGMMTAYRKNKIRLNGEQELLRAVNRPEESDERLIGKEVLQLVDHELGRMPFNMHQCFRLSRSEGKTIRAISRELNLSEQTVKNNISEATRRLRKLVKSRMVPHLALIILHQVMYQ